MKSAEPTNESASPSSAAGAPTACTAAPASGGPAMYEAERVTLSAPFASTTSPRSTTRGKNTL